MIGASSTWYATSARLRMSRSSAARVASEDAKELLCRLDDRVGLGVFELGAVVNPPPRHGDRVHAGRLRREHVERGVADVGRLGGVGSQALRPEQERLGIRLVLLGLVAADD